MSSITISREEYLQLKQQATAYKNITSRVFRSVLEDPIQEVVKDFRNTDLYADGFLADLESGLRQSSYAKTRKK